jgi:hypothetical protein
MIYPNGRILHMGYDNNALDTAFGRVDYLADDNGSGAAGSHLAERRKGVIRSGVFDSISFLDFLAA